MTFEEYWKTRWVENAMPPVMNLAMREFAKSTWEVATFAERKACADIADRQIHEEGSYYGKECAEQIRNLLLMRSHVKVTGIAA